jgi:phosphoribosylformylglycinamidine synthase PurS subunit
VHVKVFITPKAGILDPQGGAVETSLRSLGFARVSNVHVGKYIVLDIDVGSVEAAREQVGRMCEQLLANPLIEDYRFEVEPG